MAGRPECRCYLGATKETIRQILVAAGRRASPADEDGIDVFAGQGANRDTANAEHFVPDLTLSDGTTDSVAPIAVCGILTLNVSNAGNAKAGTVTIYFR